MKEATTLYLAVLAMAGILAVNVYLGLETGSPVSWACSVFVAVLIVNTWVGELRR